MGPFAREYLLLHVEAPPEVKEELLKLAENAGK